MRALVAQLQARRAEAALGGPDKARERHVGRGKLLPRDRVMNLIDPGSPFLELSPLAANGMYDDAIHGAGLITGICRIEGRECMVVCNDSTIKGGTYFPMTVKKHLRAQEIARENRLPCIYLVDSGGANLPHQTDVFSRPRAFRPHLFKPGDAVVDAHPADRRGNGFLHRWRRLRAGDVGRDHHCQKPGHDLSRRPAAVKAATGEVVSAEDLGGGDLHARKSGVVDHLAQDDHHALSLARRIVANLNSKKSVDIPVTVSRDPAHDIAEFDGLVPVDLKKAI